MLSIDAPLLQMRHQHYMLWGYHAWHSAHVTLLPLQGQSYFASQTQKKTIIPQACSVCISSAQKTDFFLNMCSILSHSRNNWHYMCCMQKQVQNQSFYPYYGSAQKLVYEADALSSNVYSSTFTPYTTLTLPDTYAPAFQPGYPTAVNITDTSFMLSSAFYEAARVFYVVMPASPVRPSCPHNEATVCVVHVLLFLCCLLWPLCSWAYKWCMCGLCLFSPSFCLSFAASQSSIAGQKN